MVWAPHMSYWLSVLHVVMYMFPCYYLDPSHPFLTPFKDWNLSWLQDYFSHPTQRPYISSKCCFCFIFWKQDQKTFMFLTSCKKQKLKSVKMEPKLQQQQVSKPWVSGLGASTPGPFINPATVSWATFLARRCGLTLGRQWWIWENPHPWSSGSVTCRKVL